jgi:hypothetical protein
MSLKIYFFKYDLTFSSISITDIAFQTELLKWRENRNYKKKREKNKLFFLIII